MRNFVFKLVEKINALDNYEYKAPYIKGNMIHVFYLVGSNSPLTADYFVDAVPHQTETHKDFYLSIETKGLFRKASIPISYAEFAVIDEAIKQYIARYEKYHTEKFIAAVCDEEEEDVHVTSIDELNCE